MKEETKLQKWAREETKIVRIRKDLHEQLKEMAKEQNKSIYYFVNKALLETYNQKEL